MILFWLIFLIGQHVADPRYHTGEQIRAFFDSVATQRPDLFVLDTIGVTDRLGLPILALKISDHPTKEEPEPRILLTAIHHAEEVLGAEVLWAFVDTVFRAYDTDPEIRDWVDRLEVFVVPEVNPDGHWIVTSLQDTSWRKNLRDNDGDGAMDLEDRSDGVDLNRNYDFHWQGGNPDPASSYYRGPSPFSEPETRAIRDLTLRERFSAAVHYHSPAISMGEIVYTPYPGAPDFPYFLSLAIQFAGHLPKVQGTGTYAVLYGEYDVGNARNWQYAAVGTYALNVEIGSYLVQPPPESVDVFVNTQLEGLFFLLHRVARGPGLSIQAIDDHLGCPIPVQVEILEIDTLAPVPGPRISSEDEAFFVHRILTPGSYTVVVSDLGQSYFPETLHVEIGDTLVSLRVPMRAHQTLTLWTMPLGQRLEVRYYTPLAGQAEFLLFDVAGRLRGSWQAKVRRGWNRLLYPLSAPLPDAVYILRVSQKNRPVHQTFATPFVKIGGVR